MVVLNKIYTKSGDEGKTALATGEKLNKYDLRIETYGTVDEANSAIGIARSHLKKKKKSHKKIDKIMRRIQNELFDLGAELATPYDPNKPDRVRLVIQDDYVKSLEVDIDTMNEKLGPLKSFILPTGNKIASHLHLARSIVRRAERLMFALYEAEIYQDEDLSPKWDETHDNNAKSNDTKPAIDKKITSPSKTTLKYANRLSDLLFVLSRYINKGNEDETLWQPAKGR